MREGIHPKYYQATVTCNCGNTFVTGSKFAPSAILSTPARRRQRLPRDVSISSTGNMAWAPTNIDTEMQTARQQRVTPLCLAVVVVRKNVSMTGSHP